MKYEGHVVYFNGNGYFGDKILFTEDINLAKIFPTHEMAENIIKGYIRGGKIEKVIVNIDIKTISETPINEKYRNEE